jgi:hypothetical protein
MLSFKEKEKHVHKFEVLAGGRAQCKCGELRQYTEAGKDSNFKVLKECDPNYKDPAVPVAPFKGQIAQQVTKPAEKETEAAPAPVPLKPEGLVEVAKYYLDNKDRIISDVKTMGRREAGKRWDIATGQLSILLRRWGVEGVARTYKKRAKESPDTATPGIGIYTLLNTNRDAITHDYHMIGEERLLKKWAIPADTWKKIKGKWGLLDEIGDQPAGQEETQEMPLKIKVFQSGNIGINLVAKDPDDIRILERFFTGGVKVNSRSRNSYGMGSHSLNLTFADLIPTDSRETQEEKKHCHHERQAEPEKESGIDYFTKVAIETIGPFIKSLLEKPFVDPRSEAYLVGYQAGFEKGVKFGYELKT